MPRQAEAPRAGARIAGRLPGHWRAGRLARPCCPLRPGATVAHSASSCSGCWSSVPPTPVEVVEPAGWLARSRLIHLLVLDLADHPRRGLDRLAVLLPRAVGRACCWPDPADSEAADRVAGVRVSLARRAWLAVGGYPGRQRGRGDRCRHRGRWPGGHAELDLVVRRGARRIYCSSVPLPSRGEVVDGDVEQLPALRVVSA